MSRRANPLVLVVAALGRLAAQDGAASAEVRVDEILAAIRAEYDVTALAALCLRGDRVVALGADGLRRRGADAKVTVDDVWHLGSCTKAMTATLCGMLVDEGRLDLDARLPGLFPEIADDIHAGFAEVTLRDLLRHRAGLPANPTLDGLWTSMLRKDLTLPEIRAEVAAGILAAGPSGKPGEYLYANTGYILAGSVLERITGRSWEDLMQERLFGPLRMSSAGFGPPGTPDRLDQPVGHMRGVRAQPVPWAQADNPPALGPAGTVHASLRDWARFIALQIGADHRDPPLISPRALAALREVPAGGDYACGFVITTRTWAHGPVLTHTGSNTRWWAVVWCAPEDGFAVLAVCNEGGDPAAKATDAACAALIQRFGPKSGSSADGVRTPSRTRR
ncbi:MAG: serine hydrolase domain-containing protein [Planctomycetota bacterium]